MYEKIVRKVGNRTQLKRCGMTTDQNSINIFIFSTFYFLNEKNIFKHFIFLINQVHKSISQVYFKNIGIS